MTGQDLKSRRAALGLTGHALAGLLGLNQPEISRWETGRVKMNTTMRTAIERSLSQLEAGMRPYPIRIKESP